MILRCLPLLTAALALAGCGMNRTATGPVQHDSQSVDRDASKVIHVNLAMAAGELRVEGGTRKLMESDFFYNVPEWKPVVRYTSSGSTGDLTIEQPGHSHRTFGDTKYEWNLRLNEQVPLKVNVSLGAGKSQLDLGRMTLQDVDINMGVGDLEVDLRGSPKQNYDVRINGGVGHATVHLPSDAGVLAQASGGIGHINARGLRKQDGHWENDAYATSPVKVHLTVQGGIGEITLIGGEEPPAVL
jgi:hypothetical protein